MTAPERIRQLADADTFKEFDRYYAASDPLEFIDDKPYEERLRSARMETGLREAVLTGHCRIGGYQAILAVLDFRFMGGSMGSVVGEKITRVFERAVREGNPIITVVTSGGARMQEGMISPHADGQDGRRRHPSQGEGRSVPVSSHSSHHRWDIRQFCKSGRRDSGRAGGADRFRGSPGGGADNGGASPPRFPPG